ncbi:MAG: phosphatase PAP2 family protein [Nibricoccus sp.]
MPTNHAPSDLRVLWDRFRKNFWLKTIGITAFITLFFVAYFRILNFPVFTVTVMPLTEIDRLVPFTPIALILYVSLWIYVPIAPVMIPVKRDLYALGWEACGVAVLGLGIFFFWPTTIPPIEIDWTRHPGFEFLKTVDASGNACPSLHVAFAVFTALRIHETLLGIQARTRLHVINWLWCAGIVYSTLAIKQHVAVDAFAGAALGVIGGKLHWTRWLKKNPGDNS